MPLDYFVECPVHRMVPDAGIEIHPLGAAVHEECAATIRSHAEGVPVGGIERSEFYSAAEAIDSVSFPAR